MTDHLSFPQKLAHNIGLIVLVSQELERNLKLLVAVTDHSAASVVERHKQLERRSLGEVVKRLLGNVTVTEGRVEELEGYFRSLLDRRNKIVHHFFETYADELAAGNHAGILRDLAALHGDLLAVATSFRTVNQAFLEGLQ